MGDAWVLVASLLGVISVCAVVMTAACLVMAGDLHRTLKRLDGILPSCDQALREVHRTLRESRKLLAKVSGAAHLVDSLVHGTYDVAAGVAREWTLLKRRAKHVLEHRFGLGNGTRVGPRRHSQG